MKYDASYTHPSHRHFPTTKPTPLPKDISIHRLYSSKRLRIFRGGVRFRQRERIFKRPTPTPRFANWLSTHLAEQGGGYSVCPPFLDTVSGRIHNETCSGGIVSLTTPTR